MAEAKESYSRNLVFLRLIGHGGKPPAEFQYPSFPLLNCPEDMAALMEKSLMEHKTKEARKSLERFLEEKAKQATTRLKKWLGLKRGRPRDFSKRERWAAAAVLRTQNPKLYSWNKLAEQFDADYGQDRKGAADRIRLGVQTVQRKKGQPK
jgi:hypothetical protein